MISAKKSFRAVICMMLSLLMMLTLVSFPASAASLSLSKTSITLTKGYATTLSVKGAGSSSVSWSTSDKSIATVSSKGKVVGKSVGNATIYATVNGTKLSCKVKVVGGKLALSSKEVTLNEGEYKYVTVRAKGSHGIKAVSGDKGIVTASWVKPWKKDDIRLKLTAKGTGTTTVKIMLTKYPDVYTTIKVTVGNDDAILQTSRSSISTTVNDTAAFIVYSDKDSSINYSFSKSDIAKISEGAWKDHYCTITVTGLKEGTTNLTLTRKDNSSVKKTVAITVTASNGGYYEVLTTQPKKQKDTDIIHSWVNPSTSTYRYMLLPKDYDAARVNSIVCKDKGKYEYYLVYAESPSKLQSTDSIKTFSATVDNKAVTRYVLIPASYDVPSYNTAVASYTKKFEYWTIYNTSPEAYKYLYTDVVKTWTATVNYKAVTRYVLLPLNYDQKRLDELIAKDTGTAAGGYYAVSTTIPAFKNSTDQVITFQALQNGVYVTCYILVPANYDEARVNDAIATFTGEFEYWKVYTIKPTPKLSYDVIQSWTKLVDSKQVTRYMLLPVGYNEELFQQYKNQDLGTSSSAYYTVTTSYPNKIESTDIIWYWFNEKQQVAKYMLLPANYDVLKRNDIVYKDTGVFDYYTIYSTSPAKRNSTDVVLDLQYQGGVVYMLVPQNWDPDKVNQGLAGLRVY